MNPEENNQLRKDHYVYVLKDKNGVIRYVGHGRLRRMKHTGERTEEFLEIYNDGGTLHKIHENLTKSEATNIERDFLKEHIGKKTDEVDLINKLVNSNVFSIKYKDIKDVFYYDETSPTFLRWNTTIYSGTKYSLAKYKPGDVAGYVEPESGYGCVRYNKKYYRLHRVIYCLCHKTDIPNNLVVNHIDSNPSNNNINNLELASFRHNNIVAKRQPSSNTGIIGVMKIVQYGKFAYQAFVSDSINGKLIRKTFSIDRLGEDEALRLAIEARQKLVEEHY